MLSTDDQAAHSPQKFAALQDENTSLKTENTSLRDTTQQLQGQVKSLEKQVAWFKQQVFGSTSEKRLVASPDQAELLAGLAGTHKKPQPEQETITYQRKKRQKNRGDAVEDTGLRFDDSVEVKEIRLPVPELEGDEADQYVVIDEHITCRLAQRRSAYVVLKYIQPVVKHKVSSVITTKSAPTPVFEKSIADVSFLVGLLLDKFLYHQPLYRQHQSLLLSGITLSRTTLTNYVHRSAELLQPIYDAMLKNLLLSRVLAMDETPTKAGRKAKGKMKQAWFWTLLGDRQELVFYYSPSRARNVVDNVLAGFSGTLLTDGYAAYSAYAKDNEAVTHAQCWMHNRRGYFHAQADEPEGAETALDLIATLYKVEATIKELGLTPEARLAYRSTHSKPLVDQFFAWVYAQQQRVDLIPHAPFSKAIQYSANHEDRLRVFLSDPEVAMDTGAVERGLRPIPLGQKNWLFNWSEVGAHYTAVIQTLIVSCRLLDIHPRDYLVDVLQRMDHHPAAHIDELTPSQWKARYGKNFLRSDVDQ